MKFRSAVRHFNKHFLNPLTSKIARASWGPFAIIYHVGRRSGKLYETPIWVFPTVDGFVIALTYGPEVDWYKNVSAAGRCRILWHRREYALEEIESTDAKSALPFFPRFVSMVLRSMRVQHFVKMKFRTAKPN